jgi:hypothetical protein
LKQLIVVIFELSDETYSHQRIHAALLRCGHACSLELVRALVRELGLVPCQPQPWRHSLTEMIRLPGRFRIWSSATSPLLRRARRWSAISRTFRRGRVGYSSPP